MARPDYMPIARSICEHGVNPGDLATALNAAYDLGRYDGIDREEADLLLRSRLQSHTRRIDRLSAAVHALALDVQAGPPREIGEGDPARADRSCRCDQEEGPCACRRRERDDGERTASKP